MQAQSSQGGKSGKRQIARCYRCRGSTARTQPSCNFFDSGHVHWQKLRDAGATPGTLAQVEAAIKRRVEAEAHLTRAELTGDGVTRKMKIGLICALTLTAFSAASALLCCYGGDH